MSLKMSMTFIMLILLSACSQSPREVSRTEILMGTKAQVIVKNTDKEISERAIELAFTELKRIEKIMNRRDPTSELSEINSYAGKGEIQVSDDVLNVLLTAEKINELSGGAFDPTVEPAIKLWDEVEEPPPSKEELAAIRKKVGWRFVRINIKDKTLFLQKGVNLDLDGIAKGYAADMALASAVQRGAQCVLVNVGGDIVVHSAFSCPSWDIGINNPLGASEQVIFSVQIRSGGIATSGPARRYWLMGGEKFPRILNPQTLFPPANAPLSATAFAGSATEADAWATVAAILGDVIRNINNENIPSLLVLTKDKKFVFNEQWRKNFGVPNVLSP